MTLLLRKKGVEYCLLGRSVIRMDRLVITLTDFAYTMAHPNGEIEVPLEKIHSRCAANALVHTGYLKKTEKGYAVTDPGRFQALKEELFEKANKRIDKKAKRGGK